MLRDMTAVVLLLAFAAICAFVSGDVVGTRTQAPAEWSLQRRANPAAPMNFIIALQQQNLDVLERKFWSVSDPKSSEYRQFMSIGQIGEIIAPKAEEVSAVLGWLLSNEVTIGQIKVFVDALEVQTSVAVAERLFETEIHEFYHAQWERTVLRQFGSFSLPCNVRPLIYLIMGLANFPRFRGDRLHTKPFVSDVPDVLPDVFGVIAQTCYELYKIPEQTAQNASSITSQGVIEFQEQYFSPAELQEYGKLLNIPITALTDNHIIGKNKPLSPQAESTLDLQLMSSVNIEAMNWFWLEDDNTWLYGFATHFFNTTDVPQVISISYGWWEGDQCSKETGQNECAELKVDSQEYISRVNVEFQKIALRGISVLVASGDTGAHTRTDQMCLSKTLRSEFPASSPYITSVGASQLTKETTMSPAPKICSMGETDWKQCAASGIEVAVSFNISFYTSGGGFSEMLDQPSYQTSAVQAYLKSGVKLPPATMYNASRRAHPDVAAVGNNNLLYGGGYGTPHSVGGTSASAPIFAAVVALLNQASIAKSGKPLGFLNPLLYQIYADEPTAFNDITEGDNRCTELGCLKWCEGWEATKGWDPVTGLGTPNYGVLLKEVNKLGNGRIEASSAVLAEQC